MHTNRPQNPTAAVVVTHNRIDLLRQCVAQLENQTCACDILVVDNASTDGTAQWLESQPDLHCRNTGANLGGAGGFNLGMRWAVETGYDYVWVMDDDTLPQPDALEKLLEADKILEGNYGWLSSVVLWVDGSECRMNRQKLNKRFYEFSPLLKYGLVQAEQATFVSLFLRSETIRRFGLPIKEFFIWGDDIEFTRRIAVRGGLPCFTVGQSQVIHATKAMWALILRWTMWNGLGGISTPFGTKPTSTGRRGSKGAPTAQPSAAGIFCGLFGTENQNVPGFGCFFGESGRDSSSGRRWKAYNNGMM